MLQLGIYLGIVAASAGGSIGIYWALERLVRPERVAYWFGAVLVAVWAGIFAALR